MCAAAHQGSDGLHSMYNHGSGTLAASLAIVQHRRHHRAGEAWHKIRMEGGCSACGCDSLVRLAACYSVLQLQRGGE